MRSRLHLTTVKAASRIEVVRRVRGVSQSRVDYESSWAVTVSDEYGNRMEAVQDFREADKTVTETPSDAGASPSRGESNSSLQSFAGRLDYLFRTVHPQGQRPPTYDQVAEALTQSGIDISANYVWMLRTGRRDNPTLRHIEGLARFFGVTPAFLTDADEAERMRPRIDAVKAVADTGVQHVALRGSNLDEESLQALRSLLQRAQTITEGMGTVDNGTGGSSQREE